MQTVWETPQTGAQTKTVTSNGSIYGFLVDGATVDGVTVGWSLRGSTVIDKETVAVVSLAGQYLFKDPIINGQGLPLTIAIGSGSVDVRVQLI